VIDQGGHATRAIVYDSKGHCVCHAEVGINTITRNVLEVEHDPVELINSVNSVIDEVHKQLGDNYSKIQVAGLATQRSSIVCWDNDTGKALSPIISWQDRRTSNNISQFEDSSQIIHELTGLYLNPHYGASKIHWCLNHLSDVKKALSNGTLYVGPLASYIMFHMLDKQPFIIDPANGSRTLMMDVKTADWAPELLTLFSIPANILPEIVNTKSFFGNIVRHSNSSLCDDSHQIPLLLCTGDQSAAIFSEGELAVDEVFVNAGTGAFILKTSKDMPDLQSEKLLASVVYADKKIIKYVIEGTVNGAGRALQWFAEQSNIFDYESMLDKWSEEYHTPPIFINAISGVGSPYWVADHESYFVMEKKELTAAGIKVSHEEDNSCLNNEERFVAVLESIVFLIAENIKCIQRVSERVNQIRLAGGITASHCFCQKLANLLKCNVVLAQEKEATAKGVFFLLSGKKPNEDKVHSAMFHPNNDPMLIDRNTLWADLMKKAFSN